MPRKHLVASQTNSKQQQNAKLWQKLAREIKAAVKVGGPNPDANPRLKAAIDRALDNNLSRESIEKNINGSQKKEEELISVEYECYGPNGLQIIVESLTDNTNRVASNLRGYLSKLNASIAKPNSVKVFFDKYGVFTLKKESWTLDSLLEKTIDYQIIDIHEYDDGFEILCPAEEFYKLNNFLRNEKLPIIEAVIKYVPQNYLEDLPQELDEKIKRFINSCNNDEDIQNVTLNYELS